MRKVILLAGLSGTHANGKDFNYKIGEEAEFEDEEAEIYVNNKPPYMKYADDTPADTEKPLDKKKRAQANGGAE